MDDVDSVEAQIAHNMLTSGDWVTAHLDGVPFLEKPPLNNWMIAVAFRIFGAHDWAARIPMALSAIALALVTAGFGLWAFGKRAGLYAGLCIATCVGLFLFTRILIPDVTQTLTIALAVWAFMRVLDDEEAHPRVWAAILAVSLGVGLLLKSLIGVVFPLGAGFIYLLITRQFLDARTWRRLRPFSGILIILLIAAPWHVLATLRNPPYFCFTMKAVPGEYHGFFWFFFINEQLLRFLNLRYPRDYDTVPRLWFWLFNLIWLFPWSVYLPATFRLSYRPHDRAGKVRLMALCWIGFVMVFFTFSTTQEYYSMPIYPALALLIGSAMTLDSRALRIGTRVLTVVCGLAALTAVVILILVRHVPTPGDISTALTPHPAAYKLSLGHMEDLTLDSFAYLRFPLGLAAAAFLIGAAFTLRASRKAAYFGLAVMMVIFFQAARLAMVKFDPYLSSRPLITALERSPHGTVIVDHHYFWFSSVFFYTDRPALLLNGEFMGLLYGSHAPTVANVFIDDKQFQHLWLSPSRCYIFAKEDQLANLDSLVGKDRLITVKESGGKYLLTNQQIASTGESTFHAIISSDACGRSRSMGNRAGSAGASHRS